MHVKGGKFEAERFAAAAVLDVTYLKESFIYSDQSFIHECLNSDRLGLFAIQITKPKFNRGDRPLLTLNVL